MRLHLVLWLALLSSVAPAISRAQASVSAEPDALKRADAAFRAGYAALQAGNLEQARTHFADAARLAPAIPEGREALGEVLFELDRPAEAAVEFEAALHLKPGDPGIEANLALAYAKSGDPSKAVTQFNAAYSASQTPGAQPVDAAFLHAYARALSAIGKPDEAIAMFQLAIERGASTPDVFDDLGSLYAQSGNWALAQPQFERALSVDPSYVPARIHLGVVQRQQHQIVAALASLETAVAAAPTNALAQSEFGRTLAAAGQDEAATPHLEQAAQLNPDLPGIQDELAMALQRQGRQQEAIPWFQQAIQREPKNVSALTNLGLALTLTGKAKDALTDFQQAMAIAAPDATLYKDQGVAHVQLSAFDEAIADFQAALRLDPNDPQLHYDLGMAYKFKDRVDDAIAELTRAGQRTQPPGPALHPRHSLHADRQA